MRKYEKYKPSEIEWLGEIPEHWEVKRVKDAAQICNGKSQIDVSTDDETRYPIYGSGGVMGYATDFIYKKISLLLGRKGTIDKPLYVVNPFWTIDTMFYTKINDKSIFNKYFYYSSLIFPFKALSTNTALPSMTQQSLSLCQMCFPPLSEQTAIANYLDTKTTAIDRKIELLTAKADKYKALRRSLINENVCRGLNPNAPLKNSGIEWIGMIPEHWEVKRVKEIFYIGRGRVIGQDELVDEGRYPVFSSQTENNGCLGYIDTFDFNTTLLTWTTDGANAGTLFKREGKFNCTNVCGTLKPKKRKEILDFILYVLQIAAKHNKRIDTNGAKIMNNEMSVIPLLYPPIEEQDAIAQFLNEKTTQIDTILTNISEQISKLTQLRKTLINDVVTGKIKVTED